MKQVNRLDVGGRIDRSAAISFTFNGKQLFGFKGDTIASALLANGVKVVSRSFKYKRARGIIGAGSEECNAIFQVELNGVTTPNLRATQTELVDKMIVKTIGGWPSFTFDLSKIVGLFHRLMPPGFYYKTFIRPKRLWPLYEKFIRKSTGLGVAPSKPDLDHYDGFNQHCDVLIIGAGAAGIARALKYVNSSIKVMLVDEQQELGGSLLSYKGTIDAKPCQLWLKESLQKLASCKNITLLSRTTAFGFYGQQLIVALERRSDHLSSNEKASTRERLHRIRAKQIVLATGAIERPMVFANNDKPGVMLASSVSTYINRYGVLPGKNIVLFTANNEAYQTALDAVDAGAKVKAIVDLRADPEGTLVKRAKEQGITLYSGFALIEAVGRNAVKSVKLAKVNESLKLVDNEIIEISCDLLAMSAGFSPVVHLSSHTGIKPYWDEKKVAFLPGESPQNMSFIGACNGKGSLFECLNDDGENLYQLEDLQGSNPIEVFRIPHLLSPSRAPKQFVDFQLDVSVCGILLSLREGYHSIEHVKRYTAAGFGTDQGKLGNVNTIGIVAKALGKSIAEVGTTVFRPSYTPSTFGAIAGPNLAELLAPIRKTAIHQWHEDFGAKWENVGDWKRPWYYPKNNESMQESINRECLAVRQSVGMLDASTLGKIDIQGKDAAEFINRIYSNPFLKLAIGKCRYGFMLKEDGMVFDDGVTARLSEHHYLMFTTTGGAANVLSWLEFWHQTEWPELEVYCNSVTDHWVTVTLSGPNSRKVLAKVCQDLDLSNEAFKFMDVKEAYVCGIKARIFRISFTGELSFEINVPANYGNYIWQQVYDAGEEFNITPYGTETMHVLRAEKGFIIVGQDTDGSVTPQDLNMDWIVGKKKTFSFIGKRGLVREDCVRANRKQLVGLKTTDPLKVIPEGGQLVNSPNETQMQGHVSSSYYSATLGHSIALALVKGGLDRMGEKLYCPLANGEVIQAEIISSVFYDAKGERQNVE